MQMSKMIAGGMVLALFLAACSSSFDDAPSPDNAVGSETEATLESVEAPAIDQEAQRADFDRPRETLYPSGPAEIRVIRDGRVDLRIEKDDFGRVSAQLRTIAADLGGYISSGETHLEEVEGVTYTVGWFTIRVPEVRFEEAMAKAEELGERIGLSVSSQDVSEEFIDLEGRLEYWKTQEAFFLRLMDETTRIDELVALQNEMRDVLLQIEAIEGRIRYLDSRTQFSTLTVGLTEVPGTTPVPVDPTDPGILMEALDTAGTVLLSMVAFIIVAMAFALPIGIVALIAFGVWRAFGGGRRNPEPTEA